MTAGRSKRGGRSPLPGKTAVAALIALPMLLRAAPADAGTAELVGYIQRLIESGELPQVADDARIEINDNGNRVTLTGQQLKELFAQQWRLVKDYKAKDFKVESADCGPQNCVIRYDFRMSEKLGNSTISQSINSEEEYRLEGDGFVMIRSSQVQKKEDEL